MPRAKAASARRQKQDSTIEQSTRQDGVGGTTESAAYSMLNSLVIAARHHDVHLAVTQIIHDNVMSPQDLTWPDLATLARNSGLRAVSTRLTWADITRLGKAVPAIVRLSNGYTMILMNVETRGRAKYVVLRDPMASADAPLLLDEVRFMSGWTGEVLLLKRNYAIADESRPFGMESIFNRVFQYPRLIRDIVIAGFMLGLLGAAPIIFWRLLIDRVLYYHSLDTFAVLCVAMVMLVAFEAAFSWLRRRLSQDIIQRIDVAFSTELFDKLLNLPVSFFERTQTGKVLHDVHEIYKIRNFISGQLFGTMLDALILVVFIPLMIFFSPLLTLLVLSVCAVICTWVVIMLPALHRKSAKVQGAEGDKGAFLSETLLGIRTVKSLALDARRRREWDVLVARAAGYRDEESSVANTIQTVILPLERLMTTGVIAVAVYMSVSSQQQAYVGALVAFMMLSMRVAAPLMQLSTGLQEYDEARTAIAVIGRMINQPKEEGRSELALRPLIAGQIEFIDVKFTYPGSITPALAGVSFTVPKGKIFGIMGRSGSGKTTVTRLLQMLHAEYNGQIRLDGNNLTEIEIDHLRSSIGVVLQDNFLFSGTVAATISATKPDATLDEIMTAARLAGADEFIERLPAGYRTVIREGSSNLSGGQKQRLAIARALIGNPRVLILDEATSALDAESEAIVNANLLSIAEGRTLIIISHRLSSLISADAILVLERGKVYDIGRHEELLERCDIYSSLWHQQHRHLELSGRSHELVPV